MKKLLVAAIAALALAAPGLAKATTVYVRNFSTSVSDAEIQNALPAFQAAVDQDFAPYWADAQLQFVGKAQVPSRGWTVTVTDSVNCTFCAGYHEVYRGVPRAFVAPDGWQVTFTHELFEMLGDPFTNLFSQVGKRMYIEENCDAVESYSYLRSGADGTPVQISDFVFPSWFYPKAHGPYDYMGLVSKPLQLLKGGYISYLLNGVWQQSFARTGRGKVD